MSSTNREAPHYAVFSSLLLLSSHPVQNSHLSTIFSNALYQTSLISGDPRLNHLVMLTKGTWPSFVGLSINGQYCWRLVLRLGETRVLPPPSAP